jgi:hypothetical protein
VSNSSSGGTIGLANSSNVNPSFRLEDELDSVHVQTAATGGHPGRVAFDLDPRHIVSNCSSKFVGNGTARHIGKQKYLSPKII